MGCAQTTMKEPTPELGSHGGTEMCGLSHSKKDTEGTIKDPSPEEGKPIAPRRSQREAIVVARNILFNQETSLSDNAKMIVN